MRNRIGSTIVVCIALLTMHMASASDSDPHNERYSSQEMSKALADLVEGPEADLKATAEGLVSKGIPLMGPQGRATELHANSPIFKFFGMASTAFEWRLNQPDVSAQRRQAVIDVM